MLCRRSDIRDAVGGYLFATHQTEAYGSCIHSKLCSVVNVAPKDTFNLSLTDCRERLEMTNNSLTDDSPFEEYKNRIELLCSRIGKDDHSDAAGKYIDDILNMSTAALRQPELHQTQIDFLLSRRATAFFRRFHYRNSKNIFDLDNALQDYQSILGENPYAWEHVQALLAKSYPSKRSSPKDAVTILNSAIKVAARIPNAAARKRASKQVQLNLAECLLRISIESNELAGLKRHSEKILSFGEMAYMVILPLSYAAKSILSLSTSPDSLSIVQRIMFAIDAASRRSNLERASAAQLSTHAASLSLALGPEYVETALGQYLRALELGHTDDYAFKCSIIGRLALNAAKHYLRIGHSETAVDFLRDSKEWLVRALDSAPSTSNEKFDLVVTHCCLAEAYLRLQGCVGGVRFARNSIRHFETAISLGDPPPESISLLAEAHFRVGRYLKDSKHLRLAIELKERFLIEYAGSREGWSICCAAYRTLAELQEDLDCLSRAVRAAINAHNVDPTWPWPLLQLAEIFESEEPSQESRDFVEESIGALIESEGDLASNLKNTAVRLAVSNSEFEKEVLGGRTRVYVLDDPHRLLSASLVLKPTTDRQAHAEMEATLGFSRYVEELEMEVDYILPKPIGINHLKSGKCIYAMAREKGQTLGDAVTEHLLEGKNDKAYSLLNLAIRFLATFHAWRSKTYVGRKVGSSWTSLIQNSVHLPEEDAVVIGRESITIDRLFPTSSMLLPKKDAHPENWLVNEKGKLVMLDLESTGWRPAIFEVAQLLDDYALIPVTDSGFEQRLALVGIYSSEMKRQGVPLVANEGQIESLYAISWSARAAFGLGYCRRQNRVEFSTAQKRLADRTKHYLTSLEFIKQRFSGDQIGVLAAALLRTVANSPNG